MVFFIAIGHDPATELFKNQLEMDKEGYLVTKQTLQKLMCLEFCG